MRSVAFLSVFALLALGGQAGAGTDPFVGEVVTVAFNFCPTGFAPLDGRLIPITQNETLFALLGTQYGGDGSKTFALPAGVPVFTATGAPLLQCIALTGAFPPRN